MEGRDSSQLSYRWTCVLDPSLKKGPWTKEEDELLLKAVKKYGCKEWWKIKVEVPGRTDNSCRERYLDCLQADIKRGAWSDEEVELLKKLVEKHGVGKWAKIASEIPNRVDSQCLNKWKWMTQSAYRKGKKRARRRKKPLKHEPQLKRRRVGEKTLRKAGKNEEYDIRTESDTSEDENEEVPYLESDGEQPVETVPSDEDCKIEYVQTDMKEWIPALGNKLLHPSENLKPMLVRVPTEAEKHGKDLVRNTVLDRRGSAVKTYVSMMPPALTTCNSSNEHAMIMVSECDIKRQLMCMKASLMKVRKKANKTSLSSYTNGRYTKNGEKKDNSKMESGQKRKPARKPVLTTQLKYDLMIAITPWIGNLIMPLPYQERRVCEADIVQKRAEDIPLLKSSVFLFFLQALKVDADGCKKVIKARNDRVSLTQGSDLRPHSAMKPARGSYYHVKTVADILAEAKEHNKRSRPLQSPEILELQLPPQPAQTAIPSRSQQQSITKQEMQFSSQAINATLIVPQTFVVAQTNTDNRVGISHNVVQGILPLLQLGTQDASKIPQPKSRRVKRPPSCVSGTSSVPTSSMSTATETLEEVSTSKRRHTPTIKAQALMEDKKTKLSRKQATKKQQNSSVTQTMDVPPQATAWILTPTGLMSVAEIQVPEISGHQNHVTSNNVQIVFQPHVVVNQSSCVSPSKAMRSSNSTPGFPGNNNTFLTAASNLGQNCMSFSVVDNHNVSSFPSSSNFPSVISAAVKNIPSAPQVLPDTKMPTSTAESTAQVPSSISACNQNKPATPTNPVASLVSVTSCPVETSHNLTSSCISDATNNVSSVSSVSAVTSTTTNPSVHALNIFGPGTIPGPQKEKLPHSKVVFQQPFRGNQNVSLTLINTAGPCLPNATTANIIPVSTKSTSPNINKSLPASSNKGSLVPINTAGPYLIKNAPLTATANVSRVLPNSAAPNIKKSHQLSSTKGSLAPINAAGLCLIENSTATAKVTKVPPNSASPGINKSQTGSSTEGSFALINASGLCLIENAPATAKGTKAMTKSHPTSTVDPVVPSYLLIPTSDFNATSHTITHPGSMNSSVGVTIGNLPTDQLGVNSANSPKTTICHILPQTAVQQVPPQAKQQTYPGAATTSTPKPEQTPFDPSLMFFEEPAQVKNWIKGNNGITLPGLEDKMPYLPPFVSSISTLTTLLKGRDSLLKTAAQLLPEELQGSSEEEAKITAVRNMVSERFKTNQAYLFLKARFLSCFTLPALLATINPCTTDALDQENNINILETKQSKDDHHC